MKQRNNMTNEEVLETCTTNSCDIDNRIINVGDYSCDNETTRTIY